MTGGEPSLAAVVAHARRVPAADRGQLAADLRAGIGDNGLVLETCHRVEAYVSGSEDVARLSTIRRPAGAHELHGQAAIRHAISVAAGRDSVVIGEDQVLHQLRSAVDAARSAGPFDPILERLFNAAMRAGRLARSWRAGPEPSLATVALAAVAARSGPLRDRLVLIVGAGQMGRLVARAAADAGARVALGNRSPEAADAVARTVGGRSVPFDPGAEASGFAGVVVALSGRWPIAPATVEALSRAAVPVVDLSVPAALEPAASAQLGQLLITADDLARAGSPGQAVDPRATRRLDDLIDRTSSEFVAWLDGRARRTVAAALAERADLAREAELAALWRRLPALEPDARDAIDAMTRHLAERLLREPLDQLGKDVDGAAERAVREAFAL